MDMSDGLIENGNIKILYITLIVMVVILVAWVITIYMSKRHQNNNIISEMNKSSSQITDIDDNEK